MEPTTPVPALRGRVVGAVCAFGAALAHLAAGGAVSPVALVLVVVVSVALAPLVVRRGPDPAGTLALALVVQVVWHGAWTLSAPAAAATAGSGHAAGMLLTHLVAALATTVVALAVERELLAAAGAALGWLRSPGRWLAPVLPTPSGPAASPGATGEPRRLVGRAGGGAARGLRAPPGLSGERALTALARP